MLVCSVLLWAATEDRESVKSTPSQGYRENPNLKWGLKPKLAVAIQRKRVKYIHF
jgi:hypothetical protein